MNKYLPSLERTFILALLIGISFYLFGNPIEYLIVISLIGISVVFFLSAYKPTQLELAEDERLGFAELLGTTIVPKTLWIASSLSVIGVIFYHLGMENGCSGTLGTGSMTIILGSVILLFQKIKGMKHLDSSMPVLLRALPTAAIAVYILSKIT